MEDCCICLEPMNMNKNYAATKCGHKFCLTCLLQHYAIKNNCPLCRDKLCENEDNDEVMNDITPPPTPSHHQWVPPPPPPPRMIQRSDQQQLILMNGELYFMEDDLIDLGVPIQIQNRQHRQRQRRCSICHNTGHDRRRCPDRISEIRI